MKQLNMLLPSTPTPWTQTKSAYDNVVLITSEVRQIGTLTAAERMSMKGDVAFLLRAVNSHAALVNALLAAGTAIEEQRKDSGQSALFEPLYAQIKAALELAHVRVVKPAKDDPAPLVGAHIERSERYAVYFVLDLPTQLPMQDVRDAVARAIQLTSMNINIGLHDDADMHGDMRRVGLSFECLTEDEATAAEADAERVMRDFDGVTVIEPQQEDT